MGPSQVVDSHPTHPRLDTKSLAGVSDPRRASVAAGCGLQPTDLLGSSLLSEEQKAAFEGCLSGPSLRVASSFHAGGRSCPAHFLAARSQDFLRAGRLVLWGPGIHQNLAWPRVMKSIKNRRQLCA